MVKVAAALGARADTSAAQALFDLAKESGGPTSLKELGMREEDVETAAAIAVKAPYPNPVPLEHQKLLALFRDAWEGKRPN
jgi:maleylacetate reductase